MEVALVGYGVEPSSQRTFDIVVSLLCPIQVGQIRIRRDERRIAHERTLIRGLGLVEFSALYGQNSEVHVRFGPTLR